MHTILAAHLGGNFYTNGDVLWIPVVLIALVIISSMKNRIAQG